MNGDLKKMQDELINSIKNGVFNHEEFSKKYSNVEFNHDYDKLEIKFINKSTNEDPAYQTDGASGFDLRANLESSVTLGVYGGEKSNIAIIPTGLFFELPDTMELQIRARSGLAAKSHVTVLNGVGTIDSDYTGEILVILINHGKNDFVINHGDRIAQGVISAVTAKRIIKLSKVDEITKDTQRGDGKFGSTGSK